MSNNMEENRKNEVFIRNIDLEMFINTLISIYDSGADYIDIAGTLEEDRDVISIIAYGDAMDEVEPDEKPPLSDEDINKLI